MKILCIKHFLIVVDSMMLTIRIKGNYISKNWSKLLTDGTKNCRHGGEGGVKNASFMDGPFHVGHSN